MLTLIRLQSRRAVRIVAAKRAAHRPRTNVHYSTSSSFLYSSSFVSRWTASPLTLIAIVAVPAVTLAANQDQNQSAKPQDSVIEPRTGLQVPTQILGHDLVGTSARSVTFLRFLTYAFALYRDPKKWATSNTSAVLPDLIADPTGTTIRITTYRQIDATHFCSSINSGAVPRMKKILESQNVDTNQATQQAEEIGRTFRAIFKMKDLPPNTAVDFHITKPTPKSSEPRVTIFVNGTEEGSIDGSLFTNSLVALYFGNEPRSQEIQAGVQAYLEKAAAQAK